GIWESRGREEVHTYSSVMCWADCDRLAPISTHLGLADRGAHWRGRADTMPEAILARARDAELGHFVESAEGRRLDASLLRLAERGFVDAQDPRFIATVEAIGSQLRRGTGLFRYIAPDDFGSPETSFTICSF